VSTNLEKSNRQIQYKCSVCGREEQREDLTVKRVSFQTMGIKFRTIRSRVVAWLCDDCRSEDVAWNMPKAAASPGMADTKIAV
jgi:hypothetical protein